MSALRRPHRLVPSLLFAAVLCGLAPAAGAAEVPPLRSLQPPHFSADVSVDVDTSGRSSVGVIITVPYTELSWSRLGTGYGSGAAFSVELEPERRDRLYGDAWQRRLRIERYPVTASPRYQLVESRRFDVPPGRYRVRVRVRDLDSEAESSAEERLELADVRRVPVGFADLQLGAVDSLGFHPEPTRRFGPEIANLAARVVLFDRRPGAWPREYRFRYRVLEASGDVLSQGDTLVTLRFSAEPVLVRPGRPEFLVGAHVLEVEWQQGRERYRTSRSFEVEESGPPRGRAYELMLEALAYIAPDAEVDPMRALRTDAEQAAAWEAFWRRRDPTPETARNEYQLEFFRRLNHAEQNFQGFGPGWRSDMGRIYVRHGAPDQVEQRQASTQTPALEIWTYHQPYRRYVFADREGFGRFTMIQPAIE